MAKIKCPNDVHNYHCIFDNNCRLVEFCANKKINYIDMYLILPGNTFKGQRNVIVYSNDINYWLIQYPYCYNEHNTTFSITEQVKTIEKLPWHYYLAWILVAILAIICIILGILIYIVKHSKCQLCCSTDRYTKQQIDSKETVPCLQPSETVIGKRIEQTYC